MSILPVVHITVTRTTGLRWHAPMSTASAIRELLLARSVPVAALPPPMALQHRLYRAATALVPPTAAPLRAIGAQRVESDDALLAAFVRGDAEAFEALMQRHLGWMVAWACKEGLPQADGDDAVQEAFMVLVRKAAGLRLDSTLRGYLYGLLRIQVLRARRSLQRQRDEPLEEDEDGTEIPSNEPSPVMKVLAQRAHGELAEAMYRVCTLREQEVLLFDLEDAADKDIAAALEMSEGNVRVVRHRAITKLRKALAGLDGSGAG